MPINQLLLQGGIIPTMLSGGIANNQAQIL